MEKKIQKIDYLNEERHLFARDVAKISKEDIEDPNFSMNNEIFGKENVKMIDFYNSSIEENKRFQDVCRQKDSTLDDAKLELLGPVKNSEIECHKRSLELREQWKEIFLMQSDYRKMWLIDIFFEDEVLAPLLLEILSKREEAFGNFGSSFPDSLKIAEIFQDDFSREFVSDEIVLQMTRQYVLWMEREQKIFHERLPSMLSDIKDRCLDPKNGLPITQEHWDMTMKEITIFLKDPLTSESQDYAGNYALFEGLIEIIPWGISGDDEIRSSLCHEVLHALSGKAFVFVETEEKGISLVPQKGGLRFDKNEFSSESKFVWLDEALTEELNIRILDPFDGGSYVGPRKLLTILANCIVDPELRLFIDAYFENRQVNKKGGVKKPEAWSRLVAAFDITFGLSFLNKLERCILKIGDGDWKFGVDQLLTELGGFVSVEDIKSFVFSELESPEA